MRYVSRPSIALGSESSLEGKGIELPAIEFAVPRGVR